LVSADEAKQLFDIERLIQKELEREIIDDFEPNHDLPRSRALLPVKSKRPKKPNKQESRGRNRNRNRNNNDSQDRSAKNNEGQRDDQKKNQIRQKNAYFGTKKTK